MTHHMHMKYIKKHKKVNKRKTTNHNPKRKQCPNELEKHRVFIQPIYGQTHIVVCYLTKAFKPNKIQVPTSHVSKLHSS